MKVPLREVVAHPLDDRPEEESETDDGVRRRVRQVVRFLVQEFEGEGDASVRLRDQRKTGRTLLQVRERPPE